MRNHKSIIHDVLWTFLFFLGGGGGRGVLPCDVSLTPKNIDFFTVDDLLLARA